ncbi:MAG: alpha/beta fold hydrolase [Deltaproteobacteria bacterium]|nr:MAG: alpha/beta fold hydrolase [Deltaproteobacteria bacterium]
MGIGAQMIVWPDALCELLVDRGFRVIRFDNRDVGLSQKMHGQRVGDVRKVMVRALLGLPVDAPYTLVDMADDTAGLLDALGLDSAHIVGASMGGMIAQTMAIVHPHRVRSLTSLMSTAGRRRHAFGRFAAIRALLGSAPRNRDEAVERAVQFYEVCGSKGFPIDWERIRDTAGRAYDRCFYPPGFVRQFAAIAATGSRYEALRFVRAPTAVIHGSDDPLILPAAGRDVARAIPGATFRVIEGMGHDLPAAVWPILAGEIERVAARAAERERTRRPASPVPVAPARRATGRTS